MKSLTGSRKVIEILNRFGHCISYHAVEEIETELTFKANKEGLVTNSVLSWSWEQELLGTTLIGLWKP